MTDAAEVQEKGAFGLTDAERKELSDAIGHIVAYFVAVTRDARAERDAAIRRAERAEQWIKRATKPDGEVRETAVSRG